MPEFDSHSTDIPEMQALSLNPAVHAAAALLLPHPGGFEQERSPPLGLIDPVLQQSRVGDIAVQAVSAMIWRYELSFVV